MLTEMSSGAILSKTRAMFGRRLTYDDYVALSQKKSVGSAAVYLKGLTAYEDVLAGADSGIRRKELEWLLRKKHLRDFESLCRYELSIGERFSDYILLSTEIELITRGLSRIISGRTGEPAVISASPYLDRLTRIDLDAMGRAGSFDELLESMRESPFYGVLKKLGFHVDSTLVKYETALNSEFFKNVIRTVNESLSGGARATLSDMFTAMVDLENLARIVRMKEYFDASPDAVSTALIPFGNVTGSNAELLLNIPGVPGVLECAEKLRCFRGKLGELGACRRIDELPKRYILKRSLHEIYFSPHPPVVMLSYINISEIEISNIIRIIEGIRYGVEPSEIMELLILPRTDSMGN